jgi:predicted restriction endonuclease
VKRPCLTCNVLVHGRSYCRRHDPHLHRFPHPQRGTRRAQARFAAAVMKRAGGRCEVCGAPAEQAHHRTPVAAGGTHATSNGIALCRAHHREAHRA